MTTTMAARPVHVPAHAVTLEGNLVVPAAANGLVVFAHGSGSGRFSPRNQMVAETLNRAGIATLLIDLLTVEEERIDRRTAEFRFDIQRLANRLVDATDWVAAQPELARLGIGCFGASTGAAAALIAAALRPNRIGAVVSRGGRPDLAGEVLDRVRAPTLLIVGGADPEVLALNRRAEQAMRAERKLVVIEKATHLFEERGALEQVATLASEWFRTHLQSEIERLPDAEC